MQSIGNTAFAQLLHERICLLFAKLEADPATVMALAQFDRESGLGPLEGEDRETVYKRLLDALTAYEEVTGGKVHPVNAGLEELRA